MARFKWHADYFDCSNTARASVSTIIQADNANDAARLARSALGVFKRVEVRRMGTAAPIRVAYASKAPLVAFMPLGTSFPIAS